MNKIDFFALPRSLQDRVLGGLEGRFPPMPVLRLGARVVPPLKWLGLSGAAIVLLIVFHRLGYGSLGSSLARHGVLLVPVYVVLFGAMVTGVLMSLLAYIGSARLPYPPGVYVYGARLLDASSSPILNFSMADAIRIDVTPDGEGIVIEFPNARSYSFPAGSGSALALQAQLRQDRDHVAQGAASGDPTPLLTRDPLHEPKIHNPLAEQEPLQFNVPLWLRYRWGVAAILGAMFGLAIWTLRNAGSDSALYKRAVEANTPEGYRFYLAAGRKYSKDVERTLLPRSELLVAQKDGNVEALLAFEAIHRDTDIGPEVQKAKRQAYLAELERAKAKQSLLAFTEFSTKYPNHKLDAEYKGAVHDLFVAAQSKYAATSGGRSKESAQLWSRLLQFVESKGAAVELRFRRREASTLVRVDKAVAKLPEYMGEISRPSLYFNEAHMVPHENDLAGTVMAAFGKALPKELVDLRVGEPLALAAEAKTPLPSVAIPTLFVTYFSEWSGHTYALKVPRGIFVGMFFNFEVDFVMPTGHSLYHQKLVFFRSLPSALVKELETAPRTNPPVEERIYSSMTDESFKQFDAKLHKMLLGDL